MLGGASLIFKKKRSWTVYGNSEEENEDFWNAKSQRRQVNFDSEEETEFESASILRRNSFHGHRSFIKRFVPITGYLRSN